MSDARGLVFDKRFPGGRRAPRLASPDHRRRRARGRVPQRIRFSPPGAVPRIASGAKDRPSSTVVSPDDGQQSTSPYRVVILTNVPQLTERRAAGREHSSTTAGGCSWPPATACRADNYNDRFYRYGDGILPAELQPAVPESDATTTTSGISNSPTRSSLSSAIARSPPPAAAVRRYFPVTPRDYDAAILATYARRPSVPARSPGRPRARAADDHLGRRRIGTRSR